MLTQPQSTANNTVHIYNITDLVNYHYDTLNNVYRLFTVYPSKLLLKHRYFTLIYIISMTQLHALLHALISDPTHKHNPSNYHSFICTTRNLTSTSLTVHIISLSLASGHNYSHESTDHFTNSATEIIKQAWSLATNKRPRQAPVTTPRGTSWLIVVLRFLGMKRVGLCRIMSF